MGNSSNKYNDDEKKLKKSFYSLMKKTLKKRYDKNRKDLFNQSYSLFAKDFQKSYINQRIIISKYAKEFIPWKSYLMRAINNLANQNAYLWAQNLYDYLANESFPDQTKYQNMFFYQELLILTRPKSIKNILSSDKLTKNSKVRENNEALNDIYNERDEKIEPNDTFANIKMRISSNLMGSFISADSESPTSSMRRDPNYEYQYNKNKIRDYMEIFKEHINFEDHPIHLVINRFIDEFKDYIKNVIEYYKENNNSNIVGCQEKAQDIIKQIQDFIVLMQNVIKLFYSRSISYAYFRDEKDEFLNLVSYLIFSSESIYKNFFDLFELMNSDKINSLREKMEELGDLKPEDIGIKDKFCLNEKTNEFMDKLKAEKKNTKIYNKSYRNNSNASDLAININGEEKQLDIKYDENEIVSSINKNNDINELNDEIKTDSKISIPENNIKITSDSGKLNLFTKKFSLISEDKEYNKLPFGQAIEFLKKIVDFKVPLEKLIIIASVSSLITECVNIYWKNMERYIQPSMLSIDADELMTIFMYIIYKCNMPLLFVHADFIKYFTSPTTKNTMIGYYYTTLKGCLDYLLEIKNKEEFIKESK